MGEMDATWGVVIGLDAWVDHSTVVGLPQERVTYVVCTLKRVATGGALRDCTDQFFLLDRALTLRGRVNVGE